MKNLYYCIFLLASQSCTNLSDRKIEQPFIVSIIDLHEAQYVEQVLKSEPRLKGNIKVTAHSDRTVVKFKYPSKPVSVNEVRRGMKLLKDDLTKRRGRTANMLVYIFPEITLTE